MHALSRVRLVLLLFLATFVVANAQAKKPNLLFLWTDEQNARTMEAYGNTKIQTPNLNRLAKESFVFRNAYVSQPVCTPARSTVMTGLWPTQNTMVKNGNILPPEIKCLPEYIYDPEYVTAYMGKWHLGNEQYPQHGFQQWVSMEEYGNLLPGFEERRSDYWFFLKNLGYTPHPKDGAFSRDFAAALPIDHCKAKFLELNAVEFLKKNKDSPFVLYVNFLEPHMPFFGPLNDLHAPDEVDLPPNFNDKIDDDEPLCYRVAQERQARQRMYDFNLKTEQQWRRLIANYWGLVSQMDRSVGGILDALEELGLDDDTIVVFTSEHGDMMGAHRLVAKCVMYEESVQVPWLMRVPGLGRSQRIIERPVSHIDMAPTLLDLLQTESPPELPGKSLVPTMEGTEDQQEYVFIQWNGFNREYSEYDRRVESVVEPRDLHDTYYRAAISPDGWKLNLSLTDKCQLFNLNEDPHETTNLYYTGQHQDIIADMTRRIVRWQQQIGDRVSLH